MAKRITVTEEDITKAYDALGLDFPEDDIRKGDDSEEVDVDEEEVDVDEDEDDEVKKAKTKKQIEIDETDEEDDSDDEEDYSEVDDEEIDEDEEDDSDEETEKAQIFGRFERIEKALATSHLHNSRYVKALGVMIKDQSQNLSKAIKALKLANDKIDELSEINKAQSDEISELREQIEMFADATPSPKAMRNVAAVERNFNKSQQDEFNNTSTNKISKSNKTAVLDILDQATFTKGFDPEFSKACTDYEASGFLTPQTVGRLKNEFGIEII